MSTETRPAFVILRDQHDADGTRRPEAELQMGGAIVVEGRDVGPGVEQSWGEGNDRYEWEWSIGPEAIPAMVAALRGTEWDDPLALLKAWYDAGDRMEPGIHLREAGVPVGHWSSVGVASRAQAAPRRRDDGRADHAPGVGRVGCRCDALLLGAGQLGPKVPGRAAASPVPSNNLRSAPLNREAST